MAFRTSAHDVFKRLGLGIFKRLIPESRIEELARQWYPKGRERALTPGSLLGLLMVAQMENLRGSVDELLQRGWSRVSEPHGLGHVQQPVSRQAVSKRLQTLPWQIYRELMASLFTAYAEAVNPGRELFHGIFTIQAIDGSVVDVAARLIKAWAGIPGRGGGRGRKAQAKVHTLFDIQVGVPKLVLITGARRSERWQARTLVRRGKTGVWTIFVVDLGYFGFDFFRRISKEGAFFVARRKEGTRYRTLKRFGRRDSLVRVGGWTKGQTTMIVRMVGVREGRTIYWYLTNLLPEHEVSPANVRSIYQKRWSIELFFRAWKHILRGGRFFCYNTNGIKIQIYASLCAYLLVRILVAQSAVRYRFDPLQVGFPRAAGIVRCWLFRSWPHLWNLRPRQKYLDELLLRIAALPETSSSHSAPKTASKRPA